VFFGVSLIVCAYGIVSIRTQARVSAPFEAAGGTEPNTFGGYLMLVMTTALALGLYAPRRPLRWTLFAIVGIASVPFVMTLSRASYASMLVMLALLALTARRYGLLAVLAVILLGAPFLFPEAVIQRVQSTFEPSGVAVELPVVGSEVLIDKSAYERVYVWQKVRHNLSVWPFFGGGVSWSTVLDSHFARVIIETGLFGLAAFVFLLWRLLRTTRQAFRWSRDWVARALALAMFVNTMGLIVHSFGTISFLIVRIMEPYWFLMALVVVSRQIALLDHAQRAREALTRQGAATLSSSVAGLSGVQLKPMTWSEPGTSFTV
jgi:O-antigen ligase